MNKLNREELYSLEQYAEQRAEFRDRVMEHKKNRRVNVPHPQLGFRLAAC